MKSQLVSILIPAYNAERWVAEAIQSALAQTWSKKEIILVDDGSSDDTLAIARTFASGNVKVVAQAHQGASAARNNALRLCQGDYIQWLDADDVLAPDKISQQLRIANQVGSRTLLSSSWSRFYYRPYKARFVATRLWQDLSPIEWLVRKLKYNDYMIVESWLLNRQLVEAAGPWNTLLSADDDGEYLCRIVCASDQIKFVAAAKSYYRISGFGSLSGVTLSTSQVNSQFRSICLHIHYLRSLEDSERTRSVCMEFLQRWIIHFYPNHESILKEASLIAQQLGGTLEPPLLPAKYELVRKVLGWDVAKKAMFTLPQMKSNLSKRWDNVLFSLGR